MPSPVASKTKPPLNRQTLHRWAALTTAPATRTVVDQDFVCLIRIGHEHVISRAVTRRIKDETASELSVRSTRAALTTAPPPAPSWTKTSFACHHWPRTRHQRAVTRRIKDETAKGIVSTLHQRAALTTAPPPHRRGPRLRLLDYNWPRTRHQPCRHPSHQRRNRPRNVSTLHRGPSHDGSTTHRRGPRLRLLDHHWPRTRHHLPSPVASKTKPPWKGKYAPPGLSHGSTTRTRGPRLRLLEKLATNTSSPVPSPVASKTKPPWNCHTLHRACSIDENKTNGVV